MNRAAKNIFVLMLTGFVAFSCSPRPSSAPETSASSSVHPMDEATIKHIEVQDKLTMLTVDISPMRDDFTDAVAQAAKQVGMKLKAGEVGAGSEQIAIDIGRRDDGSLDDILKYSSTTLRNIDYSTVSDATMLESADEVIFTSKTADDAKSWCLGSSKEAPKFCKNAGYEP